MFLSVIVPVYNAQAHLEECLSSLLRQDLAPEDYEILCVNDGSKDGSGAILTQFAEAYPNVRVLTQENQGVVSARNAGLKAACGEFIWFVDADDLVRPNCLGFLRDLARNAPCDRVIFGGYQFTDFLTPREQALEAEGKLPVNVPWQDAVVWRNLLRRSFLEEKSLYFRYPELTHGEDGLFLYEVSICAPVCVQTDRVLYYYRVHTGSAETGLSPENRTRRLNSHIAVTEILAGYYGSDRTDEMTANKLMSFLWNTLYEITFQPRPQAREALDALRRAGLYPFRRLPECTLTRAYVTDRTDLIGAGFDWLYRRLHRPWAYELMRLLQWLRRLRKGGRM